MLPSEILWIIFGYLLGSIPFGYLISRWSGKDILKIGWRKTSGSNVYRNIGKWQGVLTGILDLLKGYLAVYGAQRLGFSAEGQIFSGVAAIIGHNWSLYLKFAGGRGIGTFIGAFLALNPQVLGLSLFPFLLVALIWNPSIGTLLFLATAILLSWRFGQFEITGLFTLLSLAPILLKRLSPVKEIPRAKNPAVLFRNRLLFDNDEALIGLRIKGFFQKVNSNPGGVVKRIRPLAGSLLVPPKIGWKAAKFGVKVAKKPIEKIFFPTPEKVVAEIKIAELKKMMLAAARKIVFHQEEINKINVFPVADKDTGYNLAATLLGIEGVISQKEYNSISEIVRDIKEAAMMNARGNAGMIFTGYLMRVLDEIKNLDSVDGLKLSLAMRKGTKAAYRAILNPVDGTILDVIKAAGEAAYKVARTNKEKPSTRAKLGAGLVPHRPAKSGTGAGNIIKILEEAQKVSELALQETKEKLEVLKQNNVVDAGALGFVKILEAWLESLKELTPVEEPTKETIVFEPSQIFSTKTLEGEPKIEEKLEHRYDLVFSFKKPLLFIQGEKFDLKEIQAELSLLGNSLDIIESEERIKAHLHTNFPGKVREKIRDFEILEWRVEDMIEQIKGVAKKPLGLVVGETADLPREFLEKYRIEAVPFKVNFPEAEKISGETLYEKMKRAKKLPTTSAATFGDYFSCYKRALEKFEKILVITLPSRLSGAYSQARIARSLFKKPEKLNIFVFDCFTAEVAEGLIAMKAQELIQQGKNREEIIEYLKEFCPKVKLLGCLENLKYVVWGGRIRIPKILIPGVSLIQKAGIRFLFGLKDGRVKFFGIRFGKNIAKILSKEVEGQGGSRELRAAIGYTDNQKTAQELKNLLEKKLKVKVLFISPVSPVIGVHSGPGALLAAFHEV